MLQSPTYTAPIPYTGKALSSVLNPSNSIFLQMLQCFSIMANRYQILLLLSSFLLLVVVRTQAQDSQPNITGYACSSAPSPCQTYVFYKAQAPDFLNLRNISDLFGAVQSSNIAKASGLPTDTLSVVDGQSLLIPVSCGCMRNYSQANITYRIVKDDTFYGVSTRKFENLTTFQAVEVANPTLVPTDLQIGDIVTIPVRCKCPSKAQVANGTKILITYVVQKGDSLSSISQKFGANQQNLKSQNGVNSTLDPYSTILLPLSKKPQLAQVHSPSPSPSPTTTSPPSPPTSSPAPSPTTTSPPSPPTSSPASSPASSPTSSPPSPTKSPSSSPKSSPPPTTTSPSSPNSSPPTPSESGLHRGVLIGASLAVARSLVCIAFFVFWM